jgi:hypothetical protein
MKFAGKPDAGKPHAGFDVAGTGDNVRIFRHCQQKGTANGLDLPKLLSWFSTRQEKNKKTGKIFISPVLSISEVN